VRQRATAVPRRVKAYLDERRLLKYVIYTGLGGFALGYVLIFLLFFPGFGRSAIVVVPDVRGMPFGAARRALKDAGLDVQRGPDLNNARVKPGSVLTQVPLPGQEAGRGTGVRVILSSGPDRRPVPSIDGLEKDEAISLLQRAGFDVRLRMVQNVKDEGTVLGMAPAAGTQIPVPGIVVLTISAGPPKILAPDVTGGTADQAEQKLRAAGLDLGRISYDSTSTAVLGNVVAQSPAAGDSVRMGGSVRITIAGHNPNPPPPPPPVDSAKVPPPGDQPPPTEPPPSPPPPPPGARE
jgi:serine/threonine-protein kinase